MLQYNSTGVGTQLPFSAARVTLVRLDVAALKGKWDERIDERCG